jgi:3,4-dehydroadipyl-CoA semialdehyde dehydrogenase
MLFDGGTQPLLDADQQSACVAPTLFGMRDADSVRLVHEHEVFGPVSSLLGYRDTAHAIELAHRGMGSLVASVYSADSAQMANTARELAASHGRVHLVSPDVAKTHTGHGNVMPASNHGGPGRAGGGEELGGLRALNFYHRRSAIQASSAVLTELANGTTPYNI